MDDKTVRRLKEIQDPKKFIEEFLKAANNPEDVFKVQRRQLGDALAHARYRRRLSQAELSKLAGLKPSALSRLENGRGNPTLNTLLKVCQALGVTLVLE